MPHRKDDELLAFISQLSIKTSELKVFREFIFLSLQLPEIPLLMPDFEASPWRLFDRHTMKIFVEFLSDDFSR